VTGLTTLSQNLLLFRQELLFSQHEHTPTRELHHIQTLKGDNVIEIVDDETEEHKFNVAFQRQGFIDIKSCKFEF
jgi:hypothetical protein